MMSKGSLFLSCLLFISMITENSAISSPKSKRKKGGKRGFNPQKHLDRADKNRGKLRGGNATDIEHLALRVYHSGPYSIPFIASTLKTRGPRTVLITENAASMDYSDVWNQAKIAGSNTSELKNRAYTKGKVIRLFLNEVEKHAFDLTSSGQSTVFVSLLNAVQYFLNVPHIQLEHGLADFAKNRTCINFNPLDVLKKENFSIDELATAFRRESMTDPKTDPMIVDELIAKNLQIELFQRNPVWHAQKITGHPNRIVTVYGAEHRLDQVFVERGLISKERTSMELSKIRPYFVDYSCVVEGLNGTDERSSVNLILSDALRKLWLLTGTGQKMKENGGEVVKPSMLYSYQWAAKALLEKSKISISLSELSKIAKSTASTKDEFGFETALIPVFQEARIPVLLSDENNERCDRIALGWIAQGFRTFFFDMNSIGLGDFWTPDKTSRFSRNFETYCNYSPENIAQKILDSESE